MEARTETGQPEAEVLFTRKGHLGHILLNRPRSINALTHQMVKAIAAALNQWEHDDEVLTVLVSGAGERGLCAGGDIVAIYRDAVSGGTATARFWADEYSLNARIAAFQKPYVALMDGIVLGGGVGISAHGSHRVVTERTRIGMPETGIGFIPDVGGTFLLSRAPGELGTHAALTAAMLTGADAVLLGLADDFVSSSRLPGLVDALARRPATEVLAAFREAAPPAPLEEQRHWIDACYSSDDVAEIIARLRGAPAPAGESALSIGRKSPTALKVTLAALRRARNLPGLRAVLDQEYRVSLRALESHDFAEGVRAQVIDKDRNPQWNPPTLAEVGSGIVESYFADLGPRELGLSPGGAAGTPAAAATRHGKRS